MRISDWSSDVCSSDLGGIDLRLRVADIQIGDENARLRQRRARVQPEFPGSRTGSGDLHALTDAMDGDEGRSGPLPVRAPAIRSERRAFLLLPRPSRPWIPAARKAAFLDGNERKSVV